MRATPGTRSALVGGMLLAATLLGAAPAYAADEVPAGNAVFTAQGARVYPFDALGVGCRVLGRCDGAATALDDHATPRYLTLRPGEPVAAECTEPGLVRVRGFFDGSSVIRAWAFAGDVRARDRLGEC